MKTHWIAPLLLGLTACTPMEWVRPDATPQPVEADAVQCQQEAWREANNYYLGYRAFGPWMYRDAFSRPFLFHPVGPFYDPTSDRYLEEQRLANFCMRAKGYDLAPAPK